MTDQLKMFPPETNPNPEPPPPAPPTEYRGVRIDRNYANRSTLTRATGFIKDYDYTLNPYSGCAFGCQYCYAVAFVPETDPEKPYRRDNWGQWVRVKTNAVEQVRAAVYKGELNGKSVYMSSVTDPYQPTERVTRQTRRILQELAQAQNLGLVIQTRGPWANNDEDIALCREITAHGGKIQVNMTITTNDEGVRRACEPTCPPYRQRLEAIIAINEKVRDEPDYTACVTMTPLLPTAGPEGFARDLAQSGIDRFIIQPTHTGKINPGRFRAATRNELVHQLAEYWQCEPGAVPARYKQEYELTLEAILPSLKAIDAKIGFGQPGFGRPWVTRWHTDRSQQK